MRYYRNHADVDAGNQLVSFLAGCLTGVLVGAALGVLTAPHRGDITRRKIARRVGEAKDQVVETVEDQLENMREKEGGEDAEEEALR